MCMKSYKIYEEIIKGKEPLQCAFALEYLLAYGKENLINDAFYQDLQKQINEYDDRGSENNRRYVSDSLEIARNLARLNTRNISDYIYEQVKYRKKIEKKYDEQNR